MVLKLIYVLRQLSPNNPHISQQSWIPLFKIVVPWIHLSW